jgi:hypothetical protein
MANEFKPNVGGKVSKQEAMEWIEKYEKEMRKDKAKDTKSVFYGRDVLLKILSIDGSAGITFFLGLKRNDAVGKDTVQLVLVPTKEDGTLIWSEDGSAPTDDSGMIAFDGAYQCPPYCSK